MQHIYRGVLFIFDRHHLEHAGFICVKSHNCALVGGSRANGDRNVNPVFYFFVDVNSLFFLVSSDS